MAKAKNPARSEGARYERAAFRAYLRRKAKSSNPTCVDCIEEAVNWVLKRQTRYDKKTGGL